MEKLKKQLEDIKGALPLMIKLGAIDQSAYKTLNEALDEALQQYAVMQRSEQLVNESLEEFAGKNSNTKTIKLLKWLGSKPDGATLTEIQHYVFVTLNGNSEEDFWEKDENGLRKTRGYWNDPLYGHSTYPGIFPRFCEKINGKWHLKQMPDENDILYPGHVYPEYPWYKQFVKR